MSEDRILLVDDDVELGELLVDYLGAEGLDLEVVNDGKRGLEVALREEHSLIVLDVMLPGMNGFEVLRRIRERSWVPILMLTARGDDVDRIVGLEMGADDYLPKPFNPREMVARIRAIQRRADQGAARSPEATNRRVLAVGDVVLDPSIRTVEREGQTVQLTSAEFSLLEALLTRAGRAVAREDLSQQVLGRPLSAMDRSIDVHISSLRRKLGSTVTGVERIQTVRGVGYLYPAWPPRSGSGKGND